MCLDQPSKWLDKETKVLVSDMYMDSFVDYAETGFPGGASGKESACQNRTKRQGFAPKVGKIPWRRARQPTPVFLPGESHGQRSLVGYSP